MVWQHGASHVQEPQWPSEWMVLHSRPLLSWQPSLRVSSAATPAYSSVTSPHSIGYHAVRSARFGHSFRYWPRSMGMGFRATNETWGITNVHSRHTPQCQNTGTLERRETFIGIELIHDSQILTRKKSGFIPQYFDCLTEYHWLELLIRSIQRAWEKNLGQTHPLLVWYWRRTLYPRSTCTFCKSPWGIYVRAVRSRGASHGCTRRSPTYRRSLNPWIALSQSLQSSAKSTVSN